MIFDPAPSERFKLWQMASAVCDDLLLNEKNRFLKMDAPISNSNQNSAPFDSHYHPKFNG